MKHSDRNFWTVTEIAGGLQKRRIHYVCQFGHRNNIDPYPPYIAATSRVQYEVYRLLENFNSKHIFSVELPIDFNVEQLGETSRTARRIREAFPRGIPDSLNAYQAKLFYEIGASTIFQYLSTGIDQYPTKSYEEIRALKTMIDLGGEIDTGEILTRLALFNAFDFLKSRSDVRDLVLIGYWREPESVRELYTAVCTEMTSEPGFDQLPGLTMYSFGPLPTLDTYEDNEQIGSHCRKLASLRPGQSRMQDELEASIRDALNRADFLCSKTLRELPPKFWPGSMHKVSFEPLIFDPPKAVIFLEHYSYTLPEDDLYTKLWEELDALRDQKKPPFASLYSDENLQLVDHPTFEMIDSVTNHADLRELLNFAKTLPIEIALELRVPDFILALMVDKLVCRANEFPARSRRELEEYLLGFCTRNEKAAEKIRKMNADSRGPFSVFQGEAPPGEGFLH